MIEQGIAQTIFAQLGGRRFIAMTGARNLVGGENYLMFSLPTGFAKNRINNVRITLDWTDTNGASLSLLGTVSVPMRNLFHFMSWRSQ
jgi:hypothetical protein